MSTCCYCRKRRDMACPPIHTWPSAKPPLPKRESRGETLQQVVKPQVWMKCPCCMQRFWPQDQKKLGSFGLLDSFGCMSARVVDVSSPPTAGLHAYSGRRSTVCGLTRKKREREIADSTRYRYLTLGGSMYQNIWHQ